MYGCCREGNYGYLMQGHLEDKWEISLSGAQLEHVISRHPISPLPSDGIKRETAIERAKRITNLWRDNTFINCWNKSNSESYALWKIYCPNNFEGVAIQTTLAKLKSSIGGDLLIRDVTYSIPGESKRTPTIPDLATKKRLMFEYENEVRIIHHIEDSKSNEVIKGYSLDWDIEFNLESIRVHPESDAAFYETVVKSC